jgi:predicted NBD/HSP70 family sugar kinase
LGVRDQGLPGRHRNRELIGERHRIATPQPATPAAVAHTLKALVEHFQWKGPVGCGFPATIHNGIAKNASNIDKSWIETDAAHLFADVTGLPCHVLNDADAAGLAEMRFGTGQDRQGSSFSSPSAPASVPPSSSMASCCPIPSWVT